MRNIKEIHILAAVILVLAIAGSLMQPAQASQPLAVQPVLVTNTAVPISVSGTPAVAISGTPTMAISGTPTVAISGTPDVNFSNSAAAPLYVKQVDNHEPLSIYFDQTMANGQAQTPCASDSYTVPAGKRLVVEDVNLQGIGSDPTVETLGFAIYKGFNGYTFITQQRGSSVMGSLFYTLAQPTRIHFDEGAGVRICAFRGAATSGSMTARAWVTGYLVAK
jgi:hypothetical protein